MRLNLTILLIWLLSCYSLTAQENFTILEDDPDYAQLMIQAGIGFESDFGFRSEVPFDLSLYYHLDEIPLEFSIAKNFSVFSERKSGFFFDNLTDNEFQAYNRLDVSSTYNIYDDTKIKTVAVKVKQSTSGFGSRQTTTNYYVTTKGLVRSRIGARTGAYRYAQSITDYDAIDKSIEFADGTTFPSLDNAWDSSPSTDDNYFFTAERHLAGFLGIGYHKSKGVVIEHEDYGKRDAQQNLFIYGDVLFGLNSDIQNIGYQGQLYDLNEATSGVELKNVGFRVGVKNVLSKVYYSIEFGQRPQYFDPSFYTNITLGYSFNKNL